MWALILVVSALLIVPTWLAVPIATWLLLVGWLMRCRRWLQEWWQHRSYCYCLRTSLTPSFALEAGTRLFTNSILL